MPILRLVIPDEELPLLLNLLLQDPNMLPVTAASNGNKDPLPTPLRKTLEDGSAGNENPLSETVAHKFWKPIKPAHSINITDMLKKNAVNYTRTGLSPPETVSTNSTALLSASNRSIRTFSAFVVSIRHANPIINNFFIYKTSPLSSLISGGNQLQDRGVFLCNRLFYKGRTS